MNARPSLYPTCGHCPACLAKTHRMLRVPDRPGVTLAGARPATAEALMRHAERFGPEQVAETASEFGLVVDVAGIQGPRRPRRRR